MHQDLVSKIQKSYCGRIILPEHGKLYHELPEGPRVKKTIQELQVLTLDPWFALSLGKKIKMSRYLLPYKCRVTWTSQQHTLCLYAAVGRPDCTKEEREDVFTTLYEIARIHGHDSIITKTILSPRYMSQLGWTQEAGFGSLRSYVLPVPQKKAV